MRSGERWGQGLTKFQLEQPGGWQRHSAREDERRRSCRWRGGPVTWAPVRVELPPGQPRGHVQKASGFAGGELKRWMFSSHTLTAILL